MKRAAAAFALLLSLAPRSAAAEPEFGIVLLAHGGNPAWNADAASIAAAAGKVAPTELALGMADPAAMQKAVDALAARKVKRIVAVPLFINSSSEVLEHTRYLLGLSEKPSEVFRDAMAAMPHAHHHGHGYSEARVSSPVPLKMTAALDDDPVVAGILVERARKLSKDPKKETVFLVGHGPVDDKANERWLATMGRLAARVRARGGFLDVEVATIRDDSPKAVKQAAIEELRALIRIAAKSSRVIVVPHLIARGGIEAHVREAVEGLPVVWSGETLAPHPVLPRWVLKRAAASR